jgi:hypothetical protein
VDVLAGCLPCGGRRRIPCRLLEFNLGRVRVGSTVKNSWWAKTSKGLIFVAHSLASTAACSKKALYHLSGQCIFARNIQKPRCWFCALGRPSKYHVQISLSSDRILHIPTSMSASNERLSASNERLSASNERLSAARTGIQSVTSGTDVNQDAWMTCGSLIYTMSSSHSALQTVVFDELGRFAATCALVHRLARILV